MTDHTKEDHINQKDVHDLVDAIYNTKCACEVIAAFEHFESSTLDMLKQILEDILCHREKESLTLN